MAADGDRPTMQAIRFTRYGPPHVLTLTEVDRPPVGDDEILVRVRAAAVNPLDWHLMRGRPYLVRSAAGLLRPRRHGIGCDLAGTIEAVGRGVTGFRPGDEVFGGRGESPVERAAGLAEYAVLRADAQILPKPANLTFEEAAAVPVAGLTALQALRDRARVRPGQRVLINGAAGGVGTFAVQLAKAFGAEVTGVCGTGNVAMVRSIGADQVLDYTREDFTRSGRRYDVLLDVAANRTLAELRRVLAPTGVLVGIGLASTGPWIGPLIGPVRMVVRSRFTSQTLTPFLAHASRDDLAVLAELLEAGTISPVLDRTYPLSKTPDAIEYLEEGHARGKVVITL